jgi:hypothetical protein
MVTISSYLGGRDQEDHSLRPAEVNEIPISTNKPSMVVYDSCPRYIKSTGRRTAVQASNHKITKYISKTTTAKRAKGMEHLL